MKYVIKNCPCFNNERFIEDYLEDGDNYCPYKDIKCQDCTDCVMKQIVEKCTNIISTTFSNECFELAKEVTNLFDIEEVE